MNGHRTEHIHARVTRVPCEETTYMYVYPPDEIPVELPIVNWNWTIKNHRPYMDYPVIKERIPLPEGVSLEQLARAEAEWQRRKERLKSESRYSSDSSRE